MGLRPAPAAGRRPALQPAAGGWLQRPRRCDPGADRVRVFHRRAGRHLGQPLPRPAHRGRPALPAAPERRHRARQPAGCRLVRGRGPGRAHPGALDRWACPRHSAAPAAPRHRPRPPRAAGLPAAVCCRSRRAPGVGRRRRRGRPAAARDAARPALPVEGAAALCGRIHLRTRARARALHAPAPAGLALQRAAAAGAGAGGTAAAGARGARGAGGARSAGNTGSAGCVPGAADRRRRARRHGQRSALCRPAAREHALQAHAAGRGAGRDRPRAGQRWQLPARRRHRRHAAAGQVRGGTLRHHRSRHRCFRAGAAAADAAPRAGRPGRCQHGRPGGDQAARREHARRDADGLDGAPEEGPRGRVQDPRPAAAGRRGRRPARRVAAAQDHHAARHRGHRHPAAAARPACRGGQLAHPRPGAAREPGADGHAHRRAGHQPGRALQARAQLEPGVGDHARPRPPGGRRERGGQRLPRPAAVERQHRRQRHRAHRAWLRRQQRRQRRQRPTLHHRRRPVRERPRGRRRVLRLQPLEPRHRGLALQHRQRQRRAGQPPRPHGVRPHAAARRRDGVDEAFRARRDRSRPGSAGG